MKKKRAARLICDSSVVIKAEFAQKSHYDSHGLKDVTVSWFLARAKLNVPNHYKRNNDAEHEQHMPDIIKTPPPKKSSNQPGKPHKHIKNSPQNNEL